MTGADHYLAAQKLLSRASHQRSEADPTPLTPAGQPADPAAHAALIARAQVHATLALAAASAWPIVDRYKGDSALTNEWSDAIGWVVDAEILDERDERGLVVLRPAGHDHLDGEPLF